MNPQPTNHRRRGRKRARLEHSIHPHTRPGTVIVPVGAQPTLLRATAYGPDELIDKQNVTVAQIRELRGKKPVLWIDAIGLGDGAVIEDLGQLLGLHPLSLEDLVNIPQRSKVEEYPGHLYAVTQVPSYNGEFAAEQISIFTGQDFVLTWRERGGLCFDLLRKRLQVARGVTRSAGVDYLTYAALDAVVDSFFPVLEVLGDEIDELDEQVERASDLRIIGKMRDIRNDVRQLRRIAWPLRDAIDALMRRPSDMIGDETTIHLRDCHDHVVQIIDTLENCRDACGDIRDYYATAISNRMNEIMKVLTVISTIFMPLGFIAGVYGMNFENMPELHKKNGYFGALGFMALVTAGQVYFFYRRGWLRRMDVPPPKPAEPPAQPLEHPP